MGCNWYVPANSDCPFGVNEFGSSKHNAAGTANATTKVLNTVNIVPCFVISIATSTINLWCCNSNFNVNDLLKVKLLLYHKV